MESLSVLESAASYNSVAYGRRIIGTEALCCACVIERFK